MNTLGGIFYLIALALSFFAGFNNGTWPAIVISGFVMYLGSFCIRLPQIYNQSFLITLKAFPLTLAIYSALCSIPFLVGRLFG